VGTYYTEHPSTILPPHPYTHIHTRTRTERERRRDARAREREERGKSKQREPQRERRNIESKRWMEREREREGGLCVYMSDLVCQQSKGFLAATARAARWWTSAPHMMLPSVWDAEVTPSMGPRSR
jgi:hypothetical protein